MKLNSSMKFLVATAITAIAATSAKATQVPQYNNGDLLLGFYDESGTITNDYLVDLGPIGNLNLNSSFTLSLGLNADLTHVFGSTWDTSGNIVFGLAASFPLTGQVFASNPNAGTPWGEAPHQGTTANQVGDIGQQYSNATQSNSETNPAGLEQANGATESWESIASAGLGSYSGPGGDGAISDVTNNALEFDQINQGTLGKPSTNVGSFSLNSAGNLSFAAVPEPSAFAAIALGAGVLAFAGRRRSAFARR